MTHQIDATVRAKGTAQAVRESGKIPAVLYGPETTPVSLAVPTVALEKLYKSAGASSFVDVVVDGKGAPDKPIILDIQYDPVAASIIHVDFRQVNMKTEMDADVELRLVGESPAVKGLGGTLIKAMGSLPISCLPGDLLNHIDIDLSVLKTFDDIIRVKDLPIPAGVRVRAAADATIAKVAAPLTEEQLKAMEEGVGPKSLEDIQVEEKGKKEEEGEAGAAEGAAEGEKPAKGGSASSGEEKKKE
jgi:large subunit ribosomal protein L25